MKNILNIQEICYKTAWQLIDFTTFRSIITDFWRTAVENQEETLSKIYHIREITEPVPTLNNDIRTKETICKGRPRTTTFCCRECIKRQIPER